MITLTRLGRVKFAIEFVRRGEGNFVLIKSSCEMAAICRMVNKFCINLL